MRGGSQDFYSSYFNGFIARKKPILSQDTPSSEESDENHEAEEMERSGEENQGEQEELSNSNNTKNESSSLYVVSSASKSNIQRQHSNQEGRVTGSMNMGVRKSREDLQIPERLRELQRPINQISKKIVSISQNSVKAGTNYNKGLSLNSIKIKNAEQIEGQLIGSVNELPQGTSAALMLRENPGSKGKEGPIFYRKGIGSKGLKSARYGKKKEGESLRTAEEEEQGPRLIGDESPKGYEKGYFDEKKRPNHLQESLDLQKMIDKAELNSQIELPALTMKITSNLYINKPLKIKGRIGTKLEVNEGSIFIELSEEKVSFSEITFSFDSELKNRSAESTKRNIPSNQSKDVYELGANSYQDSNKSNSNTPHTSREYLLPLFVIKGNTNVELSDCVLKSFNATPPSSLRSSEEETKQCLKELHDVCFLLKPFKVDKKPNKNSLVLRSCSVSGFTCCVDAGPYSFIMAENSFFSDMRGFTLNISNPRFFRCRSCRFEKIEKSAINIRFSRDETQAVQVQAPANAQANAEMEIRRSQGSEQGLEVASPHAQKRVISISDNEIKYGFSYGISIYSENTGTHQTVHLRINKNKLIKTTKESIFLKNLNLDCIELLENRVENCCSNGICIQSVIDFMNGNSTELTQNNIMNCSGTGLVLIDSQVRLERNDINNNDKGGLLLKFSESLVGSEFFRRSPLRNIVSLCNIFENREYGIAIMGALRGPVIITSSHIYENYHGIYIKEKGEDASPKAEEPKKSKKKEQPKNEAIILLEKSRVLNNKSCGVYLEALTNSAYISDTIIKENVDQAVYLAEQKECNLIKFKDKDLNKIKENIEGLIGGPWGQLFGDKQGAAGCKGNKCVIF